MKLKFKKLNNNAIIPNYGSEYSAGADLSTCITEDIVLNPSETKILPTGLAIEIPERHFGMVCSRSGLAAKYQIVVLNSPGIIDSDYRGEIKLIMINYSNIPFVIKPSMRLAQIIIVPFLKATWIEFENLSETIRGNNGLGSTGC